MLHWTQMQVRVRAHRKLINRWAEVVRWNGALNWKLDGRNDEHGTAPISQHITINNRS
ncbi:MAG: hypothetical protein ACKER6_00920 [Candidatus Hodgkinia cicadicola]